MSLRSTLNCSGIGFVDTPQKTLLFPKTQLKCLLSVWSENKPQNHELLERLTLSTHCICDSTCLSLGTRI